MSNNVISNYKKILSLVKNSDKITDKQKHFKKVRGIFKETKLFLLEELFKEMSEIKTIYEFYKIHSKVIKKYCRENNLEFKKLGKQTKNFWLQRGFNEKEVLNLRIKRKNNLSPFTVNFWINKGYSLEESEYKRNSIRPIKKEYWLEKGYNEEEAIKKAIETKNNNNLKGAKQLKIKKKEKPYLYNDINPTQIKYWLKKGYSDIEAKEKLRQRQSTFSKKKCIEKYGEEEGLRVFNDRQQKWLNTLNNKTKEEKEKINKKKCWFDYDNPETVLSIFKNISTKNPSKYNSLSDYYTFYYNQYMNNPYSYIFLTPIQYYEQLPILFKKSFNKNIFIESIKKYHKPEEGIYKTKIGFYNKKVKEGLLRSLKEIAFYKLLIKHNIKFELERKYPNTLLRCDFYLLDYDIYIEIAGNMRDINYYKKMKYKEETYKAVILSNTIEYNNFIEGLLK